MYFSLEFSKKGNVSNLFALQVIETNCDSVETSLNEIKKLIDCLPPEAYATLRYLCFFLWEVSLKEAENKMSAGSLGIVFGPNVFRCGENSINAGVSVFENFFNLIIVNQVFMILFAAIKDILQRVYHFKCRVHLLLTSVYLWNNFDKES